MKQQAEGLHSSQCPVVELNHHTADNSRSILGKYNSEPLNCSISLLRPIKQSGFRGKIKQLFLITIPQTQTCLSKNTTLPCEKCTSILACLLSSYISVQSDFKLMLELLSTDRINFKF